MKPLFTIHAGEYLVGALIEQRFKRLNVWIPLRDTGIDLLVSDRRNSRSVSLQVKFSKDFLVTHMGPAFQKQLRACGWWTINRDKLRASPADYWISRVEVSISWSFPGSNYGGGYVQYTVPPRPSRATSGSRKRSAVGKHAVSIGRISF